MKTAFAWPTFSGLLAASFSSCNMLGAGSHMYCEPVAIGCSSDTVIQRLVKLKKTGRFNDIRSFPDGPNGEQNNIHNFFFYDSKHQILVRLEVPLHTPSTTKIHLAGIKNFASDTQWLGFTDAPTEKQQVVLAWFNYVIRPGLTCEPFVHP